MAESIPDELRQIADWLERAFLAHVSAAKLRSIADRLEATPIPLI